ncbi:hypothetical protein GXW74_15750 [Roseomonas eburnea]|uniref:Uncharacterized protein n=1 Tax=Neoroseomonas eburnea TaxID=1346889 RepID=A0A9X9XE13_9PROT|nr:hypothetical protein [Neoroseomonas eburnea]MBR0681949.1 hypothetical protein [Neoroseomonas eburnea]
MPEQPDNPLDGRGATIRGPVTPAEIDDGGIYAEGALICVRPRRSGNALTLGGAIAEAQNETTAAEIARRCAMHDPAITAMRVIDMHWSRNGRETPETMALFYPAWQVEAWQLIRVLLDQEGR